jgi:hypothetical protein
VWFGGREQAPAPALRRDHQRDAAGQAHPADRGRHQHVHRVEAQQQPEAERDERQQPDEPRGRPRAGEGDAEFAMQRSRMTDARREALQAARERRPRAHGDGPHRGEESPRDGQVPLAGPRRSVRALGTDRGGDIVGAGRRPGCRRHER